MQPPSPAVAGAEPAAPFGMSRSSVVCAFVGVLLGHAALIAVFIAENRAPASRPVESIPIVAQLLSAQADATPVAVQSPVQQSVNPAHREAARQHENPPPQRIPSQRAPALAPAQAVSPAPVTSPAQTSQAATDAANAERGMAQPTAAAASASSAAAPATHETLAIAAPKHVEHADCRIVKPTYPELSKRRDETGTATVRFVIGATGAIETVALVKSSGFPRLDDAAVGALRASTCQPYVENGAPIRVSYTQAFTFGLDDD